MIFVDTGAWFALHVPQDPNHTRAIAWLRDNSEQLLTTDAVVSETLTLLRARRESSRAIQVGRSMIEEGEVELQFITPQEFHRAWILFQQSRASGWSFVDCSSKVIMDTLRIRQAFTFDTHFQQFGSIEVVPN